jgi:hypothetical protein
MDHERRRLLREVLQRAQATPPRRYRPEKHYMRGPGPKTLANLGRMLRDESDDLLGEPIPDRWLDLIGAMEIRKEDN